MMALRAPWTARISSSSLIWVALLSRLVVAWMTKTMRNVTIVVAVLITSCHVSEKSNSGPVTSHVTITAAASSRAYGEPAAFVTRAATSQERITHGARTIGPHCAPGCCGPRVRRCSDVTIRRGSICACNTRRGVSP